MGIRSGVVAWVAVVGLGGLVLADPGGRAPRTSTPLRSDAPGAVALPVRVERAVRQTSYEVVDLHAGKLTPGRESALGFERSGRMLEVLVEPGDRVEPGQPLARLDRRELEAERRERIAERTRLEAQVALSEKTAARQRQLHEAGYLAAQQLDESEFGHAAERAQLEAARAALESLEVRLALSEIRAPFAGTVVERLADEGSVVSSGQVVLRLVDHRREVHLGVPPAVARRMVVGSTWAATAAAGELSLELTAVVPQIDATTHTLRLILAVRDGGVGVHPGELVRVALPERIQADGFWVPISALTEGRRGLWSAYVAVPDATTDRDGSWALDLRQLDLIHAAGDRAFVRGMLFDGDAVVVEGVHRLVPAQRVRVVRDGEAT